MAKDPYKYFRIEAQELLDGLSRGLLTIERDADPSVVRELLRYAHTLKGAARVVKQTEIGKLAHELEDWLTTIRDGSGSPEPETVGRALDLVDQMRANMALLDAPPSESAPPATAAAPVFDGQDSIRVRITEMDEILQGIGEALRAAGGVQRHHDALDAAIRQAKRIAEDRESSVGARSRADNLVASLTGVRRGLEAIADDLAVELVELQSVAADLRLIPVRALQNELERTARDASVALGKSIELRIRGADTRMDAHVLSGLRGPLRHLIQNAVAHGIEPEPARRAAGKPTTGQLEVSIERRGHSVAIQCTDDGSGFDIESVRRLALERGLIEGAAAREMPADRLVDLLVRGGLSTAKAVTDIAGRGVGLDVAREAVERLKGEMAIETAPGTGTTVELVVPVSLSAMPALAVEIDQRTVLIPLDSVRYATRVAEDEVSRSADGAHVVVDGDVLPFVPLQQATRTPLRTAVVVESRGKKAAVGVDGIRGVQNVVMRTIPASAHADPLAAGAAISDSGVPQIVLAPAALVELAAAHRPAEEPAKAVRPHLLVIDDSLTTRMLEQSILESAGYQVSLAISGEDAFQKLETARYDLFIVDVEMPGMNGFEFIETARARPDLKDIPSILVTSRADAEDKRRGMKVGARAYIVKSEFDQRDLLSVIRSLVGSA